MLSIYWWGYLKIAAADASAIDIAMDLTKAHPDQS